MLMKKPAWHAVNNIPPDREDGSSSFVHRALVATGRLGLLPPWALLPLWVGLIGLVAWLWRPLWLSAGSAFTLFVIVNWALLELLPRAQRSWGPVTPPLLGLVASQALIFAVVAALELRPWSLTTAVAVSAVISGVAFYSTWIEPFRIQVQHRVYPVSRWQGGRRIRAMHLSDIHFEAMSPRERHTLSLIDTYAPDVIFITGDYLNLSSVYDPEAQEGARRFLTQIQAPLGVYCITGSPAVDVEGIVPEIFEDLPLHWLSDQATEITVDNQSLWIMGVRNTYHEARDIKALTTLATQAPQEAFRVLLYHTPDLMPTTIGLGVDLYLCGHTHGGQIQMPAYGALATSSKWGKRYEHGEYHEGETTLYVSRGLGVEGLGAPRARFLAPPEIIIWDFEPSPS